MRPDETPQRGDNTVEATLLKGSDCTALQSYRCEMWVRECVHVVVAEL